MANVRLNQILLIFLCLQMGLFMYQPAISIHGSTAVLNEVESSSQTVTTLTVLVVLMEFPDDPRHPFHTVEHFNDLFFNQSIMIWE